MTPPILTVRNLSKSFRTRNRKTAALADVSFDLHQGEIFGVTGPSGCGKSTLARSLLRLIEPESGEIKLNGTDWKTLGSGQLRHARRMMQLVFQNSSESFNRFASVEQTITDPLRIHQIVEKPAFREETLRLLDRVGLSPDLLERNIMSLSGGQRQRVAIARALSCRPKILILDEAVSALDMISRRKILELIAALNQESQLSAIFISHDFAAIKALCHRTAVMDAGRIIEEGETQALIAQPRTALTRSLLDAVPSLVL